jgi:nicotinate-nucleotide adenylyltransferase
MTSQPRRIGILGGTFDPIHRGHLDVGRVGERVLNLSRVFVIPSNIPPHRQQTFASAFHRFAMTAMAVADYTSWRASDLELRYEGPSYTAETLKQFHERGYPPSVLYFLIGADAFMDIATWRDYPKVLDWTHFVVVSRPGHPAGALRYKLSDLASRMADPPIEPMAEMDPLIILIDEPTADVSSTGIRERRAQNEPITGMVSPRVEQHILQHGLYAARSPGRRRSDQTTEVEADKLHGQS